MFHNVYDSCIFQQLLMQEAEETGLQSNTLPELPLPAIDSNATKVLLGSRPQPPQGKQNIHSQN